MAETITAEPLPTHSPADLAAEDIVEQSEETTDPQTALIHPSANDDGVVNIEADGAVQKKTKKIIRRKKRPARPQVDPSTIKSEPPPQTGTIFNIWYNKWSGMLGSSL
jgi:hypothetical protein